MEHAVVVLGRALSSAGRARSVRKDLVSTLLR